MPPLVKNYLVFIRGIQKLLHGGAARGFIALRRLCGEVMHPAMDVGVFAFREVAHAVQNLARLLRRCRAIEIDQWLAINRLVEDREIFALGGGVELGLDGFGLRRHDTRSNAQHLPPARQTREWFRSRSDRRHRQGTRASAARARRLPASRASADRTEDLTHPARRLRRHARISRRRRKFRVPA